MATDAFKVETDAATGVATLTLTRPGDGNRLADPDIRALAGTIAALGAEPTVKLALLRAEGERFCMGRNPGARPATPPDALGVRTRVSTTIMAVYAAIRNAPVPVIGVVQGEASGFGCALAAQCDITLASSAATFSLPELDHDFPPTLAMSALLHKVPAKVLTHMVYTRCVLSAAEARAFGLVSEVAAPGELDAAAARLVARLADRSRVALGSIKEYLAAALPLDSVAAGKLAENMIAVAIASNG